jgi:hypothetical protein
MKYSTYEKAEADDKDASAYEPLFNLKKIF